MAAFFDAISQDPKDLKMEKLLAKDPFQNIVYHQSGPNKLFKFHCAQVFIAADSLKRLRKYVKFVPLSDISPRLSGKSYFTIACVCETWRDLLFLSDLKTCKRLLSTENCPYLKKYDLVAIANAQVGSSMKILSDKQIIRIGRCENVEKCSCAGDGSEHCSVFVDSSKRTTCKFHCSELFKKAGNTRMLLKQNTKVLIDSPTSSPARPSLSDRKPLIEISAQAVKDYIDNHSGGRAALFQKAMDPKGPKIGSGLSTGDIVLL
jgi:hypothetical protein